MSTSVYAKVAAVALTLAAAGVAQARDNVYFSIGATVAPGVAVGVSNAPVYYPPVYVQPAPVYLRPAPIYVPPAPIYVPPAPVYYQRPAPVYYYGAPPAYFGPQIVHRRGHKHKHYRSERWQREGWREHRRHDGWGR